MAKQKKTVIDQRIEKLKSLGYELVPNSQGWYQTIREVDRLVIDRRDIDYQTNEEWEVSLAKVEADHSKHLPITESEVIEEPPVASSEVSVVDEKMKKELKAFETNPLVVAIAEFEKKYKGMTFAGLEDKTGIEALKAAKKTVQKTRTFVTKHEETLKAPYLSHLNEIRSVSKKYQAMIAPIEDPLDKELDRLKELETDEEERIKADAEKEGNRRIEVLKESGMKFGGMFYEIGDTISMDYATIKAMPVEDFDKFVIKVQTEKKRLDTLEKERIEKVKAERLQIRHEMLKPLGYQPDEEGNNWTIPGSDLFPIIKISALTDDEDNTFMLMFNNISARVARYKQYEKEEADRKIKDRLVAMRSKLVVSIGLKPVDSIPGVWAKGFYFENAAAKIYVLFNSVEALTDDEFDAVIESKEKEVEEAIAAAEKKAKEEAANKIIYKQRQDQLVALGMWWEEANKWFTFTKPDAITKCSVAQGELTGKSPEAWEEVIKEVTELVATIKQQQQDMEDKRAKDKKDKEEQDAKDLLTYQERQYKLVNLGMVIVGPAFILKNEFGDVAEIALAKVKAIDADNWPRVLTEVTGEVEAVKKLTVEKRNAKLAEAEALKPEVQRATEYVNQIIFAVEKMSEYNLTNTALVEGLTKFKLDMLNNCQEAHIFIESLN